MVVHSLWPAAEQDKVVFVNGFGLRGAWLLDVDCCCLSLLPVPQSLPDRSIDVELGRPFEIVDHLSRRLLRLSQALFAFFAILHHGLNLDFGQVLSRRESNWSKLVLAILPQPVLLCHLLCLLNRIPLDLGVRVAADVDFDFAKLGLVLGGKSWLGSCRLSGRDDAQILLV